MRLLDEIRDNSGYYYIHEKMNLNDLVIMLAFVFLTVAFYVVNLIYPHKEEFQGFDMTMTLLIIGFSVPFVAHLLDRTVKFLDFKLKKNKILKKGFPYRARVIDSKKGKVIFKDSMMKITRYSYYPVIRAYVNGEECVFTSKLPMNNFHENGLKDRNVIVQIYRNEFIFLDYSPSDDDVMNLEYIDFNNKSIFNKYKQLEKMWIVVVFGSVAVVHVILMVLKIVFNYLVYFD